jgi:hypothetical protein
MQPPARDDDADLAGHQRGLCVQPGETLAYTLALTNLGNRTDTFSLGYSGNTWDVHLSVVQATLAAGESVQVIAEVTIPADAAGGQKDTVSGNATSQGDLSVFDTVELTTTVTPAPPGYRIYLPAINVGLTDLSQVTRSLSMVWGLFPPAVW